MPPFLYRCPITGYKVDGFVTEEVSEDSEDYEAVRCHPINPTTGKVLGAEDDQQELLTLAKTLYQWVTCPTPSSVIGQVK